MTSRQHDGQEASGGSVSEFDKIMKFNYTLGIISNSINMSFKIDLPVLYN